MSSSRRLLAEMMMIRFTRVEGTLDAILRIRGKLDVDFQSEKAKNKELLSGNEKESRIGRSYVASRF